MLYDVCGVTFYRHQLITNACSLIRPCEPPLRQLGMWPGCVRVDQGIDSIRQQSPPRFLVSQTLHRIKSYCRYYDIVRPIIIGH